MKEAAADNHRIPPIDLQEIQDALADRPGLRARDLATILGVDRRRLNQRLHTHIDLFVKDSEDHTWSNRTANPGPVEHRPPGPFGPAAALLPDDQVLQVVSLTTPCREVFELILDRDYSAVPVVNSSGHVVGVATAESILEHLRSLSDKGIGLKKLVTAPIRNAMEEARFIEPETFVDLQVDWQDIQHVIVGTPSEPLGILTLSDVWQILHDFTAAFVLVHEIETGLRRMILRSIEGTSTSVDDLLAAMHVKDGQVRPHDIESLAFSQYLHLMYSNVGVIHFEPLLGDRSVFRPLFEEVTVIRNDVMHFRHHTVPPSHLQTLRKFRMIVRG